MISLRKIIGFAGIALAGVLLVGCSKPKVYNGGDHQNQLEELTTYESSEYFSSLVEFGYKTKDSFVGEDFVATKDCYITDLMSEEGVAYNAIDNFSSETDIHYGVAFRLHLKDDVMVKSIELDMEPSRIDYYIYSFNEYYGNVNDWNCFPNGGANQNTPVKYKKQEKAHFVYEFKENEVVWMGTDYVNPKVKANKKIKIYVHPIANEIIIKFTQGRDMEAYANLGVTVSNLRITYYN